MGKHHVKHLDTNINILPRAIYQRGELSQSKHYLQQGPLQHIYKQELMQLASTYKHIFGWAGVSRPLLWADGGHFSARQ